jgi:putative membrane protein
MNKFFLRWVINTIALYIAIVIVPGLQPENDNWFFYIWLALIFGLVNALLRPLLKILTCPLILVTLGLFTLVINTILLYITDWIGTFFGVGLYIQNFWSAFLGALIVSVISVVLAFFVRDELEGKRRKK